MTNVITQNVHYIYIYIGTTFATYTVYTANPLKLYDFQFPAGFGGLYYKIYCYYNMAIL